jgi:urease accessory protein
MISFSGHLRLRAEERHDGRSVLADQSFRAPFHISKPYWDPDQRTLVVQVVNPTAGILGGDELRSDIAVDSGASVLVTTPSASRVFTTSRRNATCVQRFSVATGGWLEVTPEPLVPHRASRFHQSTFVDVEPGGGLFFVDQLLPGRIGHGETWLWDQLRLEITVSIGRELVLRERFLQSGATLRELANLFGPAPTACFANAVFIPQSSDECADGNGTALLRPRNGSVSATSRDNSWMKAVQALHGNGVWVGVSPLRKHGYGIKVVAPNSLQLRDTVEEIRTALASVVPALKCRVRKQ